MHKSVLLEESIENLNLNDNSTIVDCTLGYAGHSSEILKRIPNGFLYAFDQDEDAIKSSRDRLNKIGSNYEIIKSNFVNLEVDVFEYRSKGFTLEQIAEKLNISTDYARKLSQRVNKKIIKVL